MFAFFAMLIFAMVGCGSEGMPVPDMNVINPDAGVDSDMAVIEADAGTDSNVILDDAGMDAGNTEDLGAEDSGMMVTDSSVTPDLGNEPDAGPVEDLYLVWIPENIPTGSQTVAVLNDACEEFGGVVFESTFEDWPLGLTDPEVTGTTSTVVIDGLRPFDDAACTLLNWQIVSCDYYFNNMVTFCTNRANQDCGSDIPAMCSFFVEGGWQGAYDRCTQGNQGGANHASNYNICVTSTACQLENEARNDGFVAGAYWTEGTFVRGIGSGPTRNVICVLPESAVTAEFGANYEYAVPYTGAAQ